MNIKEITKQTEWQQFFEDAGSPSFLQSWEWGEVEKKQGYEILRLGLYNKKKLVGISQVIKIKAKRGKFLFIPHGPVFFQFSIFNFQFLIKFLIKLAKQEGYSFIRIAPVLPDSDENRKIFQDLGFKKAPIYMHAERLWILDINKSEEQLLSEMRKTTRYLIKKASRDGVVVEKRSDSQAPDDFWKIYQETAKREKFVPFSQNFIRQEFEAFNKTGNALFLFGRLTQSTTGVEVSGIPTKRRDPSIFTDGPEHRTGKIPRRVPVVAGALILFTKSSAFYHQGASFHSKIPVTYLLQWEAIREAKKRGCQLYNFWGILQPGRTPKSWQGLTLFKQGFGGYQIDYLPTQDLIISPKYYLTYLYEKFLAWRRGV